MVAAGRGRHHRPPAVLPVRVLRLRPPGGRIAGVLPGRQRPPPDGERGLPHRRAVRRRAGPAAHRRRTPLPAVRGARDDTARLAYTTGYALIRRLARRAGCRTSRTPWATPTPAPPAATTAPGTTSTGTPPLPDGHPTAPHDRSATGVARQGRRRRPHTPVIARLVSADGAEEWWPARAVRWTEDAVLIGYESSPGEQKSLRHLRYRRRRASDPPSVT